MDLTRLVLILVGMDFVVDYFSAKILFLPKLDLNDGKSREPISSVTSLDIDIDLYVFIERYSQITFEKLHTSAKFFS